jgi:phosphatidylglycerophosphate synthase
MSHQLHQDSGYTGAESGVRVGGTREHYSLLAGPEKRALIWLAHRMPRWVNSDHLTALGLSASVVGGLCYWLAAWNSMGLVGAVMSLAVNWFGDSLDGTLARVRDEQRPRYGYYVDHVIDVVGALFLLGGLALSGFMTPIVAMGLLIAYLMVCAEVYLATHARGVFRLSGFGFGPTELRIVMAAGSLYLLHQPSVMLFGETYLLFDVGGVTATLGMMGVLVVSALRNTRALYLAETLAR